MYFKLCGVKITLHFSFFLVLSLFLLLDKSGWALIILISVAIHELAHLVVMKLVGIAVEEIKFSPFGIGIQQKTIRTISYTKELFVYLAGPAANLTIACSGIVAENLFDSKWLTVIAVINLVMGIFNLIPVIPLDGGRILNCVAQRFTMPKTAQLFSDTVGFILITPIAIYAFLLFFRTGNFTLFILCISLLLKRIFA